MPYSVYCVVFKTPYVMDNKFACAYFQFSAKFSNVLNKTKNCAFSPLLAAEVMVSEKALRSVLPFSDVCKDNNIPLASRLQSPGLKFTKGVTVNQATKVYLNEEHYKRNRKQKKDVKKMFNVKIKNINFSNSVGAVKLINEGMEKKTKGSIKGVLRDNDLNVDSKLILVNGLYFKGLWQMKFDPEDTEEAIFHLNNNDTVNVFLMYRKEKYNYKDSPDLDAQLLLLPFKSKEAHMLIVLPKRVTGLDRILQRLAEGYDIVAEMEGMTSDIPVRVNIPRFKIESEINLDEVLQKLGVTTVFDKAVQKVVIDVNEEGTEPKPEKMTGGFIPRWERRPIDFTADRPHLIIIIYENIPIVWVIFRGRFD